MKNNELKKMRLHYGLRIEDMNKLSGISIGILKNSETGVTPIDHSRAREFRKFFKDYEMTLSEERRYVLNNLPTAVFEIRHSKNMTSSEFAASLGVSRPLIDSIEVNDPKERVFSSRQKVIDFCCDYIATHSIIETFGSMYDAEAETNEAPTHQTKVPAHQKKTEVPVRKKSKGHTNWFGIGFWVVILLSWSALMTWIVANALLQAMK